MELGHTVDIVSYRSSNEAVLTDKSFEPIISKCNVLEIKATLSTEKVSSGLLASKETSLKRMIYNKLRKLYYSLECVDSFRKTAKNIDISKMKFGDYDLMISSSNPYSVHILAERIRDTIFEGKLKWIQYWGDALYLDTLTRSPILPFRVKKAERRLISNCDKVVYTNQVVLEIQKKLFPEYAQKMCYVETPYAFVKENSKDYEYSVGYFGSYLSSVRNIQPLYKALKSLTEESIIIGNGDQPIISSGSVTVLPRATVEEVSKYESKTRILICICNKLSSKGETGLIPGKAYHYGCTDKEVIIVGASPEVKKFLEKYERFYFVDNNAREIADMIREILSQEPKLFNPIDECEPRNAACNFLKQ